MRAEWKVVPLGELCKIQSGNSDTKDAAENGEFAFFDRSRTIKRSVRYLYDCEALIVPGEGAEFLPRHFVGKFDLHQRAYALFDFSKTLDAKFLFYFMHHLKGYFPSVAVGATVKSLRRRHFDEMPIAVTTLSEQQRLVAILDEAFAGIASAKANAEQNLRNARDLFGSHLRSLFSESHKGWARKTLREVATDFGRGKSKHRPRNDPKLYGGPYPFIQTGDVRGADQLITEYTQTYNDAGLAQSKLWPKGTLCITIAANIAETGILGFDACFPDSVIGVVVDQRQTSTKFLEYLLQTVKAALKAKGKGSAQDNINLGTFENERFPFPDLTTQASIVEKLDTLSAAVREMESVYDRKLAALDELKQSLLAKAFAGELT